MFVVRDGKAAFVPVKTGIAGEKYFEVLDGLKEGDEVITGPFASVRVAQGRRRGHEDHGSRDAILLHAELMHQFLEAAAIALQAIWGNKLRSFLTVIGNVVAVTSIIAVVSLVQGLNASVEDAIQSQFAADAFSVQRRGLTRTDEEQQPRREQSRA